MASNYSRKKKQLPPPNGQIRQSQLLTGFGPGALVDLPDHSVIIGGLEYWRYAKGKLPNVVEEPRLLAWLARHAPDLAHVRLQEPPGEHEHPADTGAGIKAIEFPRWYVVQQHKNLPSGGRARRLVPSDSLEKGKYLLDGKKEPVVPVRFVRACQYGHIDDIGWHYFCHGGKTSCPGELWLDEYGTSGDLARVWVRCSMCGAKRSMATAIEPKGMPLGPCNGQRPWLGPYSQEECRNEEGKPVRSRLLVRSASHAYFPQMISVISIPDEQDPYAECVNAHWQSYFQAATQRGVFDAFLRLPLLQAALDELGGGQGGDADRLWACVQDRHAQSVAQPTTAPDSEEDSYSLKQEELDVLMNQPFDNGTQPDMNATFFARRIPTTHPMLDRVVLVHRLREVRALIGFTRFEPASTGVDGELDLGVRRASISRGADWLPAVENKGEGIFVALNIDEIRAWEARPGVKQRIEQLEKGFELWRQERKSTADMEFPGGRYVMVHSLSHLLLTAVALECGYSASSIRERIYVSEDACGILLYTGTPDSEGTLGGLVEVGRRLEEHLQYALELGYLCSNDPVCAEHQPDDTLQNRLRHGAACHGCLLISETSCEQRNEYLDRALVVPTVSTPGAAFFNPNGAE